MLFSLCLDAPGLVGTVIRRRVVAPQEPGECRDAVFHLVTHVVVRIRIHLSTSVSNIDNPQNQRLQVYAVDGVKRKCRQHNGR